MDAADYNYNVANSSLVANIAWWTTRLIGDDKDVKEAQFEIKRCEELLRLLNKKRERDLKKKENDNVIE